MSIELYNRYVAELDKVNFQGKFLPYEWGRLPKQLGIGWMPYSCMFDEFAREIANAANQLTDYTHRLRAWSLVISSASDEDKLEAAHEFIDPLATLSLFLPYVVRSRFIFAVAQRCHQANRSREGELWKDDLPLESDIYFCHADKYGAGWRGYNTLKRRIERIADKSYQTKTRDFRHAYNHRFSPSIVIGITRIATRQIDPLKGEPKYVFGGIPPLTLELVTGVLSEQCTRIYEAFEAFQKLIGELEENIAEHPI